MRVDAAAWRERPDRSRSVAWISVIASAAVVCLAFVIRANHREGEAHLARTQARMRALHDAWLLGRGAEREALHGVTAGGSAWAEYFHAFDVTLGTFDGDMHPLLAEAQSRRSTSAPLSDEAAACLDLFAPALAALRRGAAARQIDPLGARHAGADHDRVDFVALRVLSRIAVATVRAQLPGSVDDPWPRIDDRALLDLLQLAADLHCVRGHEGFAARACFDAALVEGYDLDVLARLDRGQLTRLHTALAAVDARVDPCLPPVPMGLVANYAHLPIEQQRLPEGFALRCWRTGFSLESEIARTLDDLLALYAGATTMRDATWSTRRVWIESQLEQVRQVRPSGVTLDGFCYAPRAELHRRESVALLRRLRLDVAGRLGLEPPALVDPLTGAPFTMAARSMR